MECNIVKDLLTLYVDNLCSDESNKYIEDHLKQCKTCKKFYNEMIEKLPQEQKMEESVAFNLKEKDLLCKSRNTIKMSVVNKTIKIINVIFILLNLFILIAGIFFIFHYSNFRYPKVMVNPKYFILYIAILLPIITGIAEIGTVEKTKRYVARIVLNIFIQFTSLIGCMISVICITILPPVESVTNKPENYLLVDDETEKYMDVYCNFFPEIIPENAENIEYLYRKKEAFFSEEINITASWTLRQDDYRTEKFRVLNGYYTEKNEDGSYNITIEGVRYPGKADLTFNFDDTEGKVIYCFYVNENY